MKQFMLTNFDENDGEYIVWFGNRVGVRFASKRNIREFLADTNRFLNRVIIELNELYITLFAEYRRIWLTLMNFKSGNITNLAQEEREMQKNINDIADQFSRVGNSAHGTSSGAWSFIHLQNVCFMMNAVITQIVKISKARNNTAQYHSLEILIERITILANRLGNYPEVLPATSLGFLGDKKPRP